MTSSKYKKYNRNIQGFLWTRSWPPGPSRGSTTSLHSTLCRLTAKHERSNWRLGGPSFSIIARETASPHSTCPRLHPHHCSTTSPSNGGCPQRPFRFVRSFESFRFLTSSIINLGHLLSLGVGLKFLMAQGRYKNRAVG